jgi:hypothetical protein
MSELLLESFDAVAEAERLVEDAAFAEIVTGLDLQVPAELKEIVRTEYASNDPGGDDFNCLG